MSEEPYINWPLQGPRTTLFCCNFLNRRGGGRSTIITGGSPSRVWHRTITGWSLTGLAYKCWPKVGRMMPWTWRTSRTLSSSCAGYSSWNITCHTASARTSPATRPPCRNDTWAWRTMKLRSMAFPRRRVTLCAARRCLTVQGRVSEGQGELKQLRKARKDPELVKKSRGGRGGGRGKK